MAVPDKAKPDTAVRVQSGDTLSAIAKEAGISLKTLYELNPKFKTDPKYQGGNMIWSNTLVNIAPTPPKVPSTPATSTPATSTPATSTPATSTPTTTTPTTTTPTTTEPTTTTPTTTTPTTTTPTTTTPTTSTPPGQVDGGGATGNMPGGATGFSGGFTQAQIDAAFKAGQDAKAAEVAADKFAAKTKAVDKMIATFKAQGISDPAFAEFISGQIMNDVSAEDTLIKLYDQPAYKARFPGMEALRKKNRTITEDAYIKAENTMVETLRFFDLPAGFYDNRDMLGKIIGNEVSPKELQDRAQAAQDLAKATNPEIRTALKNFYNIGEGEITAYMLNGDLAAPLLLKQARAAEIAGLAKTAGFSAFTSTEAQGLAEKDVYKSLSLSDLTTAIGKAGTLSGTQRRLAYLENQTYSDREALAASLEADQQALLESQKRAQREVARWSGSAGITGSSLKSESGI